MFFRKVQNSYLFVLIKMGPRLTTKERRKLTAAYRKPTKGQILKVCLLQVDLVLLVVANFLWTRRQNI